MLIYNVFNQKKEFIGNLYIEKKLLVDEKNNELFKVVNKLLKSGIAFISDGKTDRDIMVDEEIILYSINEKTFLPLKNELIKLGYILEEAPVKEV